MNRIRLGRQFIRVATVLGIVHGAAACGVFGPGLNVTKLAEASRAPGNVAVFLSVSAGDYPLTDLTTGEFKVIEDGKELDASVELLDADRVSTHHTLLLLDMSGKPDAKTKRQIAAGAASFAERVSEKQSVSVYAFSGAAKLTALGRVERGQTDGAAGLKPAIERHQPSDPSRNLNGAVVSALDRLDKTLETSNRVVQLGTLVVFTRGSDVAARVDSATLESKLDTTPHRVLAIGLGNRDALPLQDIGKNGFEHAASGISLGVSFDESAATASALRDQYYLVSYCSPARAGKHRVEIRVSGTDGEGQLREGKAELMIDAKGFNGSCKPSTIPRLVRVTATTTTDAAPSEPARTAAPSSTTKEPDSNAKPKPTPDVKPDASGKPGEIVPPPTNPDYAPPK